MRTLEVETSRLTIRLTQIFSLIFWGLTLYVNFSGVGRNVALISNKYTNLITPAPLTFAIWGIIYLSVSAYVIWQLLSIFSTSALYQIDHVIYKIGLLFMISCAFNCLWLFAWTSDRLLISVILIFGLLFSLIEINQRIYTLLPNSPSYRLFLRWPFGIYLGWITIAALTNVAAYLVKIGWAGFGLSERSWTIFILVIASLISIWNVRRMNNLSFGLASIWGLGGVLLARSNDANGIANMVGITLIIAMFLILISILSRLKRWA